MTTAVTTPPARRTLFDIGRDLAAMADLLDEVGGEVTDPRVDEAVTAWLAELHHDEGRKLDGWVGFVRQMEMESAAAAEEGERWYATAKALSRRVDRMKAALLGYLQASGRTKVRTESGRTIAVQTNGGWQPIQVDAVDPADVPDELCEVRRGIDGDKVRAALAAGGELPFARLLPRGSHLRIR